MSIQLCDGIVTFVEYRRSLSMNVDTLSFHGWATLADAMATKTEASVRCGSYFLFYDGVTLTVRDGYETISVFPSDDDIAVMNDIVQVRTPCCRIISCNNCALV